MAKNILSMAIPMIGLMVIIMVAGSYATGILSANQENVNVTGTAYENEYNSSTEIQSTSLSFFQYTGLFVAMAVLFIGIAFMLRQSKRF